MEMDKMQHILTEEQYNELAQFWHEFTLLGPRSDEIGLDLRDLAKDFMGWIDNDDDEYCGLYSVEEILAFFTEKERREGTAVTNEWLSQPVETENL
jgi:hypothetical protein